ncbi:PrgI family protein [Clostridium perfringens]|nr:PrgI family protein [Clostridium perfringens]MBO3323636.1 PrgI family protein [Clostridium perfringens]MBO3332883.1 PrgI family protein [Clostridium perfringens]
MIDIRIPKEIKKYKEKCFFGLTVRQFVCVVIVLLINVPLYWFLAPKIGDDNTSWIVLIDSLPIFLVGFYKYNGMNFEQVLLEIIKSQFIYPQKRKFESENLYEILIEEDKKQERKGQGFF